MQANNRKKRRAEDRDIPLYWEPREVGSQIIKKVINAYNHDIPMISILRKVQQDRTKQGRRPLILADIYTMLVAALHQGKVQQRKHETLKRELPLKKFATMMKAWKAGELKEACFDAIRPVPSEEFVNSLMRGVNKRVADRKHELRKAPKVDDSTPEARSAMEILLLANVKTMPDTRRAVVIYLNDLEPAQLLFLRRVPSLESDMALEHKIRDPSDETLLPDEVVMSTIRDMTRSSDKSAVQPRVEETPVVDRDEVSTGNMTAAFDDPNDEGPTDGSDELDPEIEDEDEDDEDLFDEEDDDKIDDLDETDDFDDEEWDDEDEDLEVDEDDDEDLDEEEDE
jgi:hypothetical protein